MGLRQRSETVIQAVNTNEFLIVACGSTHFAIPADAVRSVVRPEEGDVETILGGFGLGPAPPHLAEQFGFAAAELAPEARLIVCRRQNGHFAFRVDRVLGLHEIEGSQIKPLLPHFTGPERQWIVGIFLFQETVALVVNTQWLLSRGRLTNPVVPPSSAIEGDGMRALDALGAPMSATPDRGMMAEFEEVTDADDAPWAEI